MKTNDTQPSVSGTHGSRPHPLGHEIELNPRKAVI